MPESHLLVDQLTVGFGATRILDRLDLKVPRGECAALVGESGSGKTTLLRCIAGLAEPQSGTIRIGDRVVRDERTDVPPARRDVALVFQSHALWPHLTAREHVRFVARDRDDAQGWLERLRIAHLADRLPGALSGGEQARLALARAFASGRGVMLLDEPLRNLDPHLAFELREEMHRWIRQAKVTALLVTHEPREAFALCDTVHVLVGGRIAASGRPEELWRRPPSAQVARLLASGTLLPATVWRELGAAGLDLDPGTELWHLAAESVGLAPDERGPAQVVRTCFEGSTVLVRMRCGDHEILARVPALERPTDGARVRLVLRERPIALREAGP